MASEVVETKFKARQLDLQVHAPSYIILPEMDNQQILL